MPDNMLDEFFTPLSCLCCRNEGIPVKTKIPLKLIKYHRIRGPEYYIVLQECACETTKSVAYMQTFRVKIKT